ncbi:hypothetical protein GPECTOR_6g543 [Gonium pectorale]|uniref:Protein kinase domain-containing protein n=1 Tax=Gonium pectorale TaxID=33097 RepID=A0A150GUS5_GONPE|nr:hypothetical protein GPECTOR_6g543 [Gonium pectorale]|eukprot:KXZ53626.1 hypothetical protein GPECTOR_6g543 [Gonium pectorale]
MRKVADAAASMQGALTLQDAILAFVDAVQACLRLTTRLELECIPAVAFRSGQVAVFLRSQVLPQLPGLSDPDALSPLQNLQRFSRPQPEQAALAHGGQNSNQARHQQGHGQGPHQGTFDISTGSCSGARALAVRRVGEDAHALASASSSTFLSAISGTHSRHQESHSQSHGASQPQRQQRSPSALASRSPGSVGREGSDQLLHLNPSLVRIKATTVSLHQTLLGHHLDLAATAAMAGTGGAGGAATAAAPRAMSQAGTWHTTRTASVGRSGNGSSCGARSLRPSEGGASTTLPPLGCGVALVPNCATYLMLDERLPYKDVLHVQRLLPQARAHSLVMVLSGALAVVRSFDRLGSLNTHDSRTISSSTDQRSHNQQRSLDCQQRGPLAQHCTSSNAFMQLLACEPEFGGGPRSAPVSTAPLANDGAVAASTAAFAAPGNGVTPASLPAAAHATGTTTAAAQGPRALFEVMSLQTTHQQPAPTGSLALYVVASESVPRVILEQVAEETRQLMQMLHLPFSTALSGLALSNEWARFTAMVLGKVPLNANAPAASTPISGGGGRISVSGHSVPPLSLLYSGAQLPTSGAGNHLQYDRMGMPLAPTDMAAVNSSSLRAYTRTPTQLSGEIDDLTCGGVSVVLDTSTPHNTGTLSLMISSMRDALSTVQLERCPDFRSTTADDIYAVRLIKLIGRGGQGMVFSGLLHNTTVAVKVIPAAEDPDAAAAAAIASGAEPTPAAGTPGKQPSAAALAAAAAGVSADEVERRAAEAAAKLQQRHKRWLVRDALEVAVTSTISHPHIVQVLNFFTDALVVEYSNEGGRYRLLPRQDNPQAKGTSNTVIVMDAINGSLTPSDGSMQTAPAASQQGRACSPGSSNGSSSGSSLNMVPLLTTLLEVASGLRHLHEHRLAHCDVKPSNVLLRSCATDSRGWTCKLSDFGCVRLMTDTDVATGRPVFHALSPVGSMSYMAPETMLRGKSISRLTLSWTRALTSIPSAS